MPDLPSDQCLDRPRLIARAHAVPEEKPSRGTAKQGEQGERDSRCPQLDPPGGAHARSAGAVAALPGSNDEYSPGLLQSGPLPVGAKGLSAPCSTGDDVGSNRILPVRPFALAGYGLLYRPHRLRIGRRLNRIGERPA